MGITKEKFIEQYAVNFISSWAASEYTNACMTGQHKRLNKPPIEDAYFLAEKSWEHRKEVLNIPEDK
jgi:hypothetical protein